LGLLFKVQFIEDSILFTDRFSADFTVLTKFKIINSVVQSRWSINNFYPFSNRLNIMKSSKSQKEK